MSAKEVNSPELPQELIDTVIDFLHGAKHDLVACSLVCRRWIPVTRYHLFGCPKITDYMSRRPSPKNAQAFISFMDRKPNPFLTYIRGASIDVSTHFAEVIAALTTVSPQIKYLQISLHSVNMMTMVEVPHLFQNVTEFIFTVPLRINRQILEIISSFPSLRSLALYTFHHVVFEEASSKNINIGNLQFLERLRLQFNDSEKVLDWLVQSGPIPYLTTFELGIYRCHHTGCGPVEHLNKFLASQCASLTHVRIAVNYLELAESRDTSPNPSFGNIDLGRLKHLQSLDIEMHDVDAISDALLSVDQSSRIKQIRIHSPQWGLQYAYDTHVECNQLQSWSRLADVIRKPQCSQLRLLDVQVSFKHYGDSEVQVVRQCLNECAERKILRFRDLGSRIVRPHSSAIGWD